jgi:hypothetical protein
MTAVGGGTNRVETVVTSWAVAVERRLKRKRALEKAILNSFFLTLIRDMWRELQVGDIL